ncbi:MAG: hypothetical protein ACI4JN_11005 [Ruminococcus sp.]
MARDFLLTDDIIQATNFFIYKNTEHKENRIQKKPPLKGEGDHCEAMVEGLKRWKG